MGVKTYSERTPAHTSIQWTDEALGYCQVFATMSAQPGGRAVHASCPRLAASIDDAVRAGDVTIGAEDGY